jgi:hypothetical protein
MGHAAQGLGDTVIILGGVTEDITAQTGKVILSLLHDRTTVSRTRSMPQVFEDALRQMDPVDMLSEMLDVSTQRLPVRTASAPSDSHLSLPTTVPSSAFSTILSPQEVVQNTTTDSYFEWWDKYVLGALQSWTAGLLHFLGEFL